MNAAVPNWRGIRWPHRQHAIIETVFADMIDGHLAHIPSGRFGANSAWILCAAIAHSLLRAAGVLAGDRYALIAARDHRGAATSAPEFVSAGTA